jgi:hypothetical protein
MFVTLGDSPVAATGIDTGDIANSLRFRSAASAYLSRTFGSPTNNKKWTYSCWVKRTRNSIASEEWIFEGGSGNNNDVIFFNTTNTIAMWFAGGNVLQTAALARDPTGHFHLMVSSDTTQASASDRLKIYINGVEASYSVDNRATYLTSSVAWGYFNTAALHSMGRRNFAPSSQLLDGYLSRVCFVDGQALTPSSFGYLNSDINEWVSKTQSEVKAVVDAGGANSFMLDFDDASSLTALGYDKSAKGNHWTLNNFSLTAGVTYDHMLDVPGNSYAVLNPLDTSSLTLSEANLKSTGPGAAHRARRSTLAFPSTGKWFFEATYTASSDNSTIGIGKATASLDNYVGQNADSWGYYSSNGQKYTNGSGSAYGATYTTGAVIRVEFDADAGTLELFKNGASQGTAFTGLTSGPYFPMVSNYNGDSWQVNHGQRPLQGGTPTTGFLALCQANLPDPAILNPREHFDVRTRVGTSATAATSNVLFPVDLIWTKTRSNALRHIIVDKVRGATKNLFSNETLAEETATDGLVSFDASGYTIGANTLGAYSSSAQNYTGYTYVDWLWKAGSTGVTNTAGSITSTVSANVEAGFSIVTWTGDGGTDKTAGHGLGVTPALILLKNRDSASAGSNNWIVWHKDIGAYNLYLNTTDARFAAPQAYGSIGTSPTSTTFLLDTGASGSNTVNESGDRYVAYCFAEIPGYSKIGSYVGNGSADGVNIVCGFKPRFVMIKKATGAANDWVIYDTVRLTYNPADPYLVPNSSQAESSGAGYYALDITSNGFKVRAANNFINTSTETYIFYAIADVAGKYSLAR